MSLEIVAVGPLPPHRGGSAFALRRVLNILTEALRRRDSGALLASIALKVVGGK